MYIPDRFKFPFFIVLCIVLNIAAGISHGYIPHTQRKWYYILSALSWLPAAKSITYYRSTQAHKKFLSIFVWFVISNTVDELFFNPLELGGNEIAFALFVVGYESDLFKIIYKFIPSWKKCRTLKKRL